MPLAQKEIGLLTRRQLLRHAIDLCLALVAGTSALTACGQRVFEIEQVLALPRA